MKTSHDAQSGASSCPVGPQWQLAVARIVTTPGASGLDRTGTDWTSETHRDDLWEACQMGM